MQIVCNIMKNTYFNFLHFCLRYSFYLTQLSSCGHLNTLMKERTRYDGKWVGYSFYTHAPPPTPSTNYLYCTYSRCFQLLNISNVLKSKYIQINAWAVGDCFGCRDKQTLSESGQNVEILRL